MPCTIDIVRQRIQEALRAANAENDPIQANLTRADYELILAALGVAEMSRDLILRLDAMVETHDDPAEPEVENLLDQAPGAIV